MEPEKKHAVLETLAQFPEVEDQLRSALKKAKVIGALDGTTQVHLRNLLQKFQRDLRLEAESKYRSYLTIEEAQRPPLPDVHPYVLECFDPTDATPEVLAGLKLIQPANVAEIKKRYSYDETKKQLESDITQAMGLLEEYLGDTYKTMVSTLSDPHEAWKVVDSLFNKGDVLNRVTLLVTILKKDCGVGELQAFLQKKQRLRMRLVKAGLDINDDLFIAIILSTLPDELELTKTLLEDKPTLTLVQLERALQNAETKWASIKTRKHQLNFTLPQEASNESTHSKKQKIADNQVSCNHCFRKNHRTVECKVNPAFPVTYNSEMAKKFAMRFWKGDSPSISKELKETQKS